METFNLPKTREAVSRLVAPVLIYAGELDIAPTPETTGAGASLFPNATVTIQPGAAHFPWLDDPSFFTARPRIRSYQQAGPARQEQHS